MMWDDERWKIIQRSKGDSIAGGNIERDIVVVVVDAGRKGWIEKFNINSVYSHNEIEIMMSDFKFG